jgi:hypothetical protein
MRRLLPLLLLCWVARCATYYVDATDGSDSANGLSAGAAWKTLAHATNQTYSVGDSVLLQRGESWSEAWIFPQDGMTLGAYGAGVNPIIDGGGTLRRTVSTGDAVDTVTENLTIQNGGGGTGALWIGFYGTNTVRDCTLQNHATDACVASGDDSHMIIQRCVISGAYDDGVTMHVTASMLMEGSTIKDCAQGINHSGTAMEMTVNDCVFTNNLSDLANLSVTVSSINRCRFDGRADGTGWKFVDGADSTVEMNFCLFDASRASSTSAPSFGVSGTVFTLRNCTFYGNGMGTISVTADGTLNATNCIWSSWWRAAYIYEGGEFNAEHCLFYDVDIKATTSNQNELTSDPLFTNAGARNYTLQAGSPALNAGLWLGAATDLAGVIVLNPPNLGAYEDYTGPYRRGTIGRGTIMKGSF